MRLLTLYQIKDRTEVTKTVNQGVYALRNSVDGKVYVGSSESISSRINRHFSELRAGVHRNHHLQHAFRLYGKSAFEFFILEQVNDAFWLRPREHAWILRLQATDHKHGYNISEDAWSPLSGVFQSEERKSRFLDAHRSPQAKLRHSIAASRLQNERPQRHTQEWKDEQSVRSLHWHSDPANLAARKLRAARISKSKSRPLIEKECPTCHASFWVKPGDKRIFCSRGCATSHRFRTKKARDEQRMKIKKAYQSPTLKARLAQLQRSRRLRERGMLEVVA